jgi:hypothetical protein
MVVMHLMVMVDLHTMVMVVEQVVLLYAVVTNNSKTGTLKINPSR